MVNECTRVDILAEIFPRRIGGKNKKTPLLLRTKITTITAVSQEAVVLSNTVGDDGTERLFFLSNWILPLIPRTFLGDKLGIRKPPF